MNLRKAALADDESEPVVIIGKMWALLWADPCSMSDIVKKHGIEIGSKLYTHPAHKLTDELKEAMEMLDNVKYWDGCPDDYKKRIAAIEAKIRGCDD